MAERGSAAVQFDPVREREKQISQNTRDFAVFSLPRFVDTMGAGVDAEVYTIRCAHINTVHIDHVRATGNRV